MKDQLFSLIRHLLTGLAGVGVFLVSKGAMAPADASVVDAAGTDLANALAALVAVAITRILFFFVGKYAPGLAPLLGGQDKTGSGTASGGGLVPLLLGMAAAGLVVTLPSCSSVFEAGTPVTTSVFYRDPSGAKGGISFTGIPKAAPVKPDSKSAL